MEDVQRAQLRARLTPMAHPRNSALMSVFDGPANRYLIEQTAMTGADDNGASAAADAPLCVSSVESLYLVRSTR